MGAALLLVWVMLALGYVSRRTRALPENASQTLNRFVILVSLPAVVLRLVPKLSFQRELGVLVVTPWVLLAVTAGAVLVLSRLFGWSRETRGALLLLSPLGNTSFLGFPLVSALMGPDAVGLAALYDQFGSFLMVSTYGLLVAARYTGRGETSFSAIAGRLVRFPPFIALVLAFLPLPHPAMFETVLERLGDTLVPLAMFAVGLEVRLRPPREWGALVLGLGLKMVVAPAVAWVIVRALAVPPRVAEVTVLEAGMPPMITAGSLAMLHGLAPELSAALVGYGILLAMLTVPLAALAFG